MKEISEWLIAIIITILLFFVVVVANASPFLVCDPAPEDQQVTSYNIFKDGELIATVDALEDRTYGFKYDLQGIQPGSYSWTAEAVNIWGRSDPTNPFVSPKEVAVPSGTRMVP